MRASRWMFLTAGAAAVLVTWSCDQADPVPPPDVPLHQGFPILGAHAAVDCGACHIDGAREQGLPPERDTGWVNALRTDCLSCHQDTSASLFPGGHKEGRGCGDSGCHSASDLCWGQVWRACGDPGDTDPPPPASHLGQTALNFPLEGPHALGCGECHALAPDYTPEIGGGDDCTKCHERALPDGPGPDHYPPARAAASPDRERGCKACHATNDATGKLLVSPDWTTTSYLHVAVWPHAVVESWDVLPAVLRAEETWVSSCSDCHPTAGSYSAWQCVTCHVAGTDISANGYHTDGTPCIQCHAEAN